MSGWEEINIGSIGEVITGNTPLTSDREFYGGSYQFIKPTDMDIDRRFVTSWEENYSEKAFKKYKNSFIPKGATGVVTIGTVGEKIFQADRPCFTNQSVNVVIPNQDKFDNNFIFYLLKYNLPKVSSANPGTASGRHHVSKSNFCSIKVTVPKDKIVQIEIGKILSAYDDLIENNLKRIKLLEEIAQRTYEDWTLNRVIDSILLSDQDSEMVQLRDMIKEYMNGGWGKENAEGNYSEKGYVLRGTDFPEISQGNINSLPLRYHTKSNLEPRKLIHGDISIEMSNGNINNIGRSFLYDDRIGQSLGSPVMCASFCKMLRPKNMDYAYLIDLHLKHIQANNSMFIYKSQAANGINNFQFEDLINGEIIVIPSGKYLALFTKKIQVIYSLISNLRIQVSSLKESRDILLPKLMNGTLNVKD